MKVEIIKEETWLKRPYPIADEDTIEDQNKGFITRTVKGKK